MTDPVYWLNGRLTPGAAAVIPLADHGLLYGDGVFEGVRFYNRSPFRLRPHLQRLALSARALMLSLPYDLEAMEAAVTEVIDAFAESDGYIRLVVTRGSGSLGLDPSRCARPTLFLIADATGFRRIDRKRDDVRGQAVIRTRCHTANPNVSPGHACSPWANDRLCQGREP